MADGNLRPTFAHGEVLSADKLNELVRYDGAQHGRHRRMLHTWGIAEGLELTKKARTTTTGDSYVDLSLTPGVAIDGYGYELVSTASIPITPAELGPAVESTDPEAWYPVFVVGAEREETAATSFAHACRPSVGTTTREEVLVEIGRPGLQRDLDAQDVNGIGIDEGPGRSTLLSRPTWRVLVGYLKWNGTRFVDAKGKLEAGDVPDPIDAVPRRYVGVRAEQVMAPAGTLYLRSASASEAGKAVVAVNYGTENLMVVGTNDGAGGIEALVSFKANGDVETKGVFLGMAQAGVHVQSGMATDGMILPLPSGITQSQIDNGAGLHVTVAPRYSIDQPVVPPSTPPNAVPFPSECWVDDDRRLHCRIRWQSTATADFVVLPGVADYQVIVTIGGA
jgi:hypothetical protein